MHLPVRTSFATDDPEVAHDHLVRSYADNELRIGRRGAEAFGYTQSRIDIGDVRLDDLHTGLPARYTMAPAGHLIVVQVLAGPISTTTSGVERHVQAGDVYLGAHHDAELFTDLPPGATISLTSVELPLLHQVDPDRAAARTARLRLQALAPSAALAWTRTTDHLRTVLDDPVAPGRLLLGAHGRLLAATLLELLDPEPDDPAGGRADARPTTVRRATAHMEAHPDHDLTLADLAQVAGVGARALQLAFRRHLDTTPLGYLRRVRLDRAHADLLAADPSRRTVTEIAATWGFADPSRFTAQYRRAYGRLPSQTLQS